MLRYAEWMMATPVILIWISNLTGLKNPKTAYTEQTMRLLVDDIGMIVTGALAGFATGWARWILFVISWVYQVDLFWVAGKVLINTFYEVPAGRCQHMVKALSWVYVIAWTNYGIVFTIGPEGLELVSLYSVHLAYVLTDCFAKNLFGAMAHFLRNLVQEHVLQHGHVRKKVELTVAGIKVEVEQLVTEAEAAASKDVVANDLADVASKNRGLANLAKNMHQRGKTLHSSIGKEFFQPESKANQANVASGRVVVALQDLSMLHILREQFHKILPQVDVVSAIGDNNTIMQALHQALMLGHVDCVIMHPELLRDSSQNGLVARVKGLGCKIITFGWGVQSPYKHVIESSGADAWMEGFGFGTGFNPQQLTCIMARVQEVNTQGPTIGAYHGGMAAQGNAAMGGVEMMPAFQTSRRPPVPNSMGQGQHDMMSFSQRLGPQADMGMQPQQQDSFNRSALAQASMSAGGQPPWGGSVVGSGAATPVGSRQGEQGEQLINQLMFEIARIKSELKV